MPRLTSISTSASVLDGTERRDTIMAGDGHDTVTAGAGDDLVYGQDGNDRILGGVGFDVLLGGNGRDFLLGGTDGDFLYGGAGDDTLFGDGGTNTAKGSDLSSDRLSGGAGDDRLVQSEGNDVMTGGSGADQFLFRWQDPMVALAAMTGRAFTSITDFNADKDTLVFDVAGVGQDRRDANFVDGGAGDMMPGGAAASFSSGPAADSDGEAVMVLTDAGFASGTDAVAAAQQEALGDLIVYFNTTVGVASLLFVDGTDVAHSIARFGNINSLAELQDAGFSANDFLFA